MSTRPGSPAPLLIAVDGPAGSGKSTVSRALARRLGVAHVDTGAYYRAATLLALRAGAGLEDGETIAALIAAARIERVADRTLVNGEDVEDEIRGPAVTAAVSTVSAHPAVRAALLEAQRRAAAGGAVVEGRDAGTVVVPHADLKVWLTASAAERAARRARELGSDDPASVADQLRAIAERDARDAAQMRRADEVVEIDTTGRSAEQVVAQVAGMARRLLAARDDRNPPADGSHTGPARADATRAGPQPHGGAG